MNDCESLVLKYLAQKNQSSENDYIIDPEETVIKESYSIFFYNTRKCIEENDDEFMAFGCAPLFVSKDKIKLFSSGTAHDIEYYIEKWENSELSEFEEIKI